MAAAVTRWISRTLLAALLLLLIGCIVIWFALRASLPQLDGDYAVTGISSAVSIERDANGAPSIHAADRTDLAFAIGFAHGQDRFFQMDLSRRNAAGELAELIGSVALPQDRRARLHRFRARAQRVLEAHGDQDRAILQAYADGVNAALDAMSGRPFEYQLLRSEPQRWTPADSLLVVFTMFFELNDERADRDTQRGFAERVLPPAVFAWLYPEGSRWDAPLMGEARAEAPIPGPADMDLRDYRLPTAAVPVRPEPFMPGSNNWAVSGDLTNDGRAIVANDMHLGLRVPSVFYRARLRYDRPQAVDITGVTLPGTPVVVAGSNGRVAWGFTNSYGDWSDAIIVRPGATSNTYQTPSGDQAFVEHRERILVRDGQSEDLIVRETIWGPVREDLVYPEGELAVSWIAHDVRGLNLRQMQLESAATITEAIAIANSAGLPPQNFVTGDVNGNIAWTIAGQIPLRDGYDPQLPVDGAVHRGFVGWLSPEEYPQVINPESGRIWTANSRVSDGQALALIGDSGYDLGARATQIRDKLHARAAFEPADMLDIQLDDRAVFLERWQSLLLDVLDAEATDGRPGRARYRELAESWLPRASVDSVGYRLVRAFRNQVQSTVFEMLMMPVREAYPHEVPLRISQQFEAPLWALVTERPAHMLTSDFPSWRALLLSAVDQNIEFYESRPGALDARTWGEFNTAAIRHPLSPVLPWASRWLDMPNDALPGDHDMPRVQGSTFGASERFAVSPGAEERSYLHLPAGQSGHPLSPFYQRGHGDWVEGKPTPFLPGPAAHRLTLTPAP